VFEGRGAWRSFFQGAQLAPAENIVAGESIFKNSRLRKGETFGSELEKEKSLSLGVLAMNHSQRGITGGAKRQKCAEEKKDA